MNSLKRLRLEMFLLGCRNISTENRSYETSLVLTTCNIHLQKSSSVQGGATITAQTSNIRKYSYLTNQYIFQIVTEMNSKNIYPLINSFLFLNNFFPLSIYYKVLCSFYDILLFFFQLHSRIFRQHLNLTFQIIIFEIFHLDLLNVTYLQTVLILQLTMSNNCD